MPSPPVFNLSSSLECPKCSKTAIVSHQSGVYQCLNCNFERDLSPEGPTALPQPGIGEFFFAIGGFLVTAALFL